MNALISSPAHLPLGAWWVIAAVAAFAFLVLLAWPMPTTAYKVRVAMALPAIGVSAVVTGHLQDLGAEQLVPMYACVIGGFALGAVGRHRQLRQAAFDTLARDAGQDVTPNLSLGANIQLLGGCLLGAAAALWFSYGS